jgi:hypothetical protein
MPTEALPPGTTFHVEHAHAGVTPALRTSSQRFLRTMAAKGTDVRQEFHVEQAPAFANPPS